MALKVGDQVTILPPYDDDDDILVRMQPYAKIAEVCPLESGGEQYMVQLGSTNPSDLRFGPFSAQRLAAGWRDASGRWR
jgi:hypothetical protein